MTDKKSELRDALNVYLGWGSISYHKCSSYFSMWIYCFILISIFLNILKSRILATAMAKAFFLNHEQFEYVKKWWWAGLRMDGICFIVASLRLTKMENLICRSATFKPFLWHPTVWISPWIILPLPLSARTVTSGESSEVAPDREWKSPAGRPTLREQRSSVSAPAPLFLLRNYPYYLRLAYYTIR